ncbi:biological adhesion [Homalodisca vitripennis]|nr:biological adhesion [Homalodisca vitripennis]
MDGSLKGWSVVGRLTSVRPDAFRALGRLRHSLQLKLTGTMLEELPPGLLAPLSRVSQLSVDLRDNRLVSLSPADLYGNATDWENLGTKLISALSISTATLPTGKMLTATSSQTSLAQPRRSLRQRYRLGKSRHQTYLRLVTLHDNRLVYLSSVDLYGYVTDWENVDSNLISVSLSSADLYGNATEWENLGTKLISALSISTATLPTGKMLTATSSQLSSADLYGNATEWGNLGTKLISVYLSSVDLYGYVTEWENLGTKLISVYLSSVDLYGYVTEWENLGTKLISALSISTATLPTGKMLTATSSQLRRSLRQRYRMGKSRHQTNLRLVNLHGNRLVYLSSVDLYGYVTEWENLGTKLISALSISTATLPTGKMLTATSSQASVSQLCRSLRLRYRMGKSRHQTNLRLVNLHGNRLVYLSSVDLYGYVTNWEKLATNVISVQLHCMVIAVHADASLSRVGERQMSNAAERGGRLMSNAAERGGRLMSNAAERGGRLMSNAAERGGRLCLFIARSALSLALQALIGTPQSEVLQSKVKLKALLKIKGLVHFIPINVTTKKREKKGQNNPHIISESEYNINRRHAGPLTRITGTNYPTVAGQVCSNEGDLTDIKRYCWTACKVALQMEAENLVPPEPLGHLTPKEADTIRRICSGFPEVLTTKLGITNILEYEIHLTDTRAVRSLPYKLAPPKLEILRNMINILFESGVIEPPHSSFSSPAFLVQNLMASPDWSWIIARSMLRLKSYPCLSPICILLSTGSSVARFVEMIHFYRRFIPNVAEEAAPLNSLRKESAKFDLQSWLCLILVVSSSCTDASYIAVSAVLSQEIDGIQQPIAYASRTLTPCTCLAPCSPPSARENWSLGSPNSCLNFSVQHVGGTQNIIADTLSCMYHMPNDHQNLSEPTCCDVLLDLSLAFSDFVPHQHKGSELTALSMRFKTEVPTLLIFCTVVLCAAVTCSGENQGGLLLSQNPWVCDCGLAWLGHWLRRWLREVLQIHTAPLDVAQHVLMTSREVTCSHQVTGRKIPLLDLYPNCQASALSIASLTLWTPCLDIPCFMFSMLWWSLRCCRI